MKVKCEVFRFDPDSGRGPGYETYVLDVEPTETALSVLMKIYREFDSSLSFRFSCGVVKCGECSILVNGSPCLACAKRVEPEMKIDPLPNLPLIKDVVIDRRKVFDRICKLSPGLSGMRRERKTVPTIESDAADRYVRLTECYECLICQSVCPVLESLQEEFIGPLGLLWLAQMSLVRKKNISRKKIESSIENCQRCGICWSSCPSSEEVLKLALETVEETR
jgi:succinate dehydrogenase/fumarate reductase iron-sulfur protein